MSSCNCSQRAGTVAVATIQNNQKSSKPHWSTEVMEREDPIKYSKELLTDLERVTKKIDSVKIFFEFVNLKSLLQRNQGVNYDEAPGQQRKPNSITAKSNSGSRMDAHEEQARADFPEVPFPSQVIDSEHTGDGSANNSDLGKCGSPRQLGQRYLRVLQLFQQLILAAKASSVLLPPPPSQREKAFSSL
ncbi:hypothetical protein MJG53_015829 [Ovis ammon polii x Ovis aries]|uniref:Uncharacterized protein n=1 Tax=Ovis ammon polii x Ovis aries TaxID=2918886 RepID=A0ACB9UC61_9CETA|nr:hypothetical protein MJT46_015509 [Ovis ammon polii x Ovis aries]KAI4564817.1 hypothetical protein MJG53_015829 [Ovis ammon polii x Ovis aries]